MNYLLYIDPGTGSMLFSLVMGISIVISFFIKSVILKIKFVLSGGKANIMEEKSIPYVIFSDHKRYWNVFKPICDQFEARKIPLVYYTQSEDDPALSVKYEYVKAEYIGEGNKGFAKMNFLNADICLSTTPGLDVLQWKRSKNCKCYVHVPHSADELAGYRMFGLDYYDAVLATGKNQVDLIRTIESLRPTVAKKEVVTVGSLVLDNLKARYDSVSHETKNEKPVVLVAPSWGKSGILSRYGEKFLTAMQKTDFKVIIRPHPQTVVSEKNILEPLTQKFSCFEWNYDNDNFDALNKADILITDFSGIIFDFACVFNRPLIYADTHFDTLPYDADWLNEKRWSEKVLTDIGVQLKEEDFENLETVIKNALESKSLSKGRDKVRSECWENVGQSAKNVVDYLVKKHEEVIKSEGEKDA